MQLLSSILFLSCLVNVILAAPVAEPPQKRQPGSFKVKRVRNPHFEPNGPAELKRAYGKYGFSRPTSFDRRLAPRNGTGKVENAPVFKDKEFLSPVTIGGQDFLLNFDTGSSDLWVFSTLMPSDQAVGHKLFDHTKSPTFQPLKGQRFAITYGDASFAQGVVGTDTVDIGGATVQSQAVELATNVSDSFVVDTASQGLVGLAFSQLNKVRPSKQKTFFDNVLSTLNAPVLSADLKHGTPGSYEFGNIDTSNFVGDLTFTDVDATTGFWTFNPSSFVIGGQSQGTTGTTAIVDTGTTLMLIDPESVKAYYSGVKGAVNDTENGFVFPCGQKLPDLGVEIEGKNFTIPGDLIDFGQIGRGANSNICFGGIQEIPRPPMIFGDVFMKAVFVVFDAGTPPKLGFAEQDLSAQGAPGTASPIGG
ncbi:hypothetical protein FGG08_006956 [Glutinoglossum americanum]|uniref:Peptidase A1 domain-containing protein n=1 Tax=Glutinoglossum americanum TaxID=1670608 RepID=A0A9P8HRP1_9PEZI|nr:hypothetical protein FGG08_006956 [Glutinoglossum americanum]